jgi:hypothetical protein
VSIIKLLSTLNHLIQPTFPTLGVAQQPHNGANQSWALSWLVFSYNQHNVAEAHSTGNHLWYHQWSSYEDDRGNSAFFLKGNSGESKRIMDRNKIPCDCTEQSSYRANFGGIDSIIAIIIIAIIDCVAKVNHITKGAIL